MADFGVSIIDSLTGIPDVNANGTTITVVDHSNYDTNTESGHDQSYFSYLYKIKFINPDGTEYLFSSLGDGDASLTVPSVSSLPISTVYTYSTGDGVYSVTLYVVPEWEKTATYNSGIDYVTYKGVVYKSIKDDFGEPDTHPKFWQVVTDIDTLSSKYRLYHRFAVDCDLHMCRIKKLSEALCSIDGIDCNSNICENVAFNQAAELDIILDNVPILVDQEDWVGVANVINLGRSICCCSND